ncbi:hypothetical protein HPP92_001509 [Vanilla planifolia]|uniref:Thioesterase domain-containing protein n=1 Tax=Vanilla planifolia TaxID=51239 RepID=A0A835VDP9_VANPL|nr:hypothetical protein HPP92_001605 [Vanilla planifolia]KAG0501437.1 hypothetical protein HPP92_001509 [Vanilla planifolia]
MQDTDTRTVQSPSKTAELDPILDAFGFKVDLVSAAMVTGRLLVTDRYCQPFKGMHGGLSALIAESLASIGAHMASNFQRVAGIQLSVNNFLNATAGDVVFARATPVHAGKTIQVWEVHLWRIKGESSMEEEALLASSRVTILSNMPVPENSKNADIALRKYAKL